MFDDKLNPRVVKLVLQHLEALRAESTTVLRAPPAWHKALSSAIVGDSMSEETNFLRFLFSEFSPFLEKRICLQESRGRPQVLAFMFVDPNMVASTEIISKLPGVIAMVFERKILMPSSPLQVYGNSFFCKGAL